MIRSFHLKRLLLPSICSKFSAETQLTNSAEPQGSNTVNASDWKSSNGHRHCEDSTEAQSMNGDQLCHSELVSESKANSGQTLKRVQGDGCTLKTCQTRRLGFNPTLSHAAFSLVEMLMALLVASLLLAALAPVMTKRMDEAKINISGVGAAQYDKDAIVTIFNNDEVFNVPNDVNNIKLTMIGGGGAGGNSFYGKQEVTTSKSWTVPEGVTKLRIFMLGGGGGGASGGLGTGTAYGDIPATTAAETCVTKDEGAHTVTIPSNASWIVPALNEACSASGETKWTLVSDPTITYEPGKTAGAELKVTACGGGGASGGSDNSGKSGGGGSGGYLENVLVSSPVNTLYVKVGGGGGGGGGCGQAPAVGGCFAGGGGGSDVSVVNGVTSVGAAGGSCDGISGGKGGNNSRSSTGISSGFNGVGDGRSSGGFTANTNNTGGAGGVWSAGGGSGSYDYGGGGGGGGGPTTISISDKAGTNDSKGQSIIFQIGGGGGGGGGNNSYGGAGGGGGGGLGSGGGGGGGGHGNSIGTTAGGAGYTPLIAAINSSIQTGMNGATCSSNTTGCGGGGGGGGYGGKPGGEAGATSAGTIGTSTIWKSANYCDGGAGCTSDCTGTKGKPGRIQICYGQSGVRTNALKCDFSLPANGSGGGGAGQLVVGEINVTPGETLYFEIGSGGAVQNIAGKNGNNGNPTRIRRGSSTGPVIAEALGGFAGHYSSAETTESQGGTFRSNIAIGEGNTLDNNWTGISYNLNSGYGENGKLHTAILNKAYGGSGGSSQNMKGEILQGGTGGNSVKNGSSPLKESYGAGGGGGSGSQSEGDSTFGIGASGAAGYIYFEYGGSNGGGGTMGELVTKYISNIKAGSEMQIKIGKGGDNSTNGIGGQTTVQYQSGSSTKTVSAKGGIRGNDGVVKDIHGAIQKLPNTYANYKSDDSATVHGQAGAPNNGGIGGYTEALYENQDGTWATYIKAKDGTIAGPILGGCGGNLTNIAGGILCNEAANTPNGKNGIFGGGGGGGAVVNEVGGLGGKGGDGVVIIEYKSTAI